MKLYYKKSESVIPPELIDATSSKTTAYIRKNVIEKQRTDETTGKTYTYYEYEESKIPKVEYEKYLKEKESEEIRQQRADIDYIALCLNVDLYD